ncbi:MAG: hypothetical protein HFF45_08660, partial [Lawsonibacter sp.]|nr:hypothetical protein [Lawsonibacter sp.]
MARRSRDGEGPTTHKEETAMPTNRTDNYALSQWERSDRILMEDFNAD